MFVRPCTPSREMAAALRPRERVLLALEARSHTLLRFEVGEGKRGGGELTAKQPVANGVKRRQSTCRERG